MVLSKKGGGWGRGGEGYQEINKQKLQLLETDRFNFKCWVYLGPLTMLTTKSWSGSLGVETH